MKSFYEKLVEEKGLEAAKEYMRSLSKRVKNRPGGGFRNPEVRKKALESREHGKNTSKS